MKQHSDNLKKIASDFMVESVMSDYSYNYEWLGRPIIQYPQDIIAIQEIIWKVKPDLIIETGIAHGGSLIFSASMLALLDVIDSGYTSNVHQSSKRKVVGVDIDIRSHNREALEKHPLSNYLHLIEGSSVSDGVIAEVKSIVSNHEKVLIILDSNHTHEHVLEELRLYAPLTSKGSYCLVMDTVIEDLPVSSSSPRPWGPGNSPKSAVREFLKSVEEFSVDKSFQTKSLITVAPDGFLQRK